MKEFNLKLDKTVDVKQAPAVNDVKTITIPVPVPTTLSWHQLTRFRNIDKLKEANRTLYDKWVEEGKIPMWAIK